MGAEYREVFGADKGKMACWGEKTPENHDFDGRRAACMLPEGSNDGRLKRKACMLRVLIGEITVYLGNDVEAGIP